MKEWNEYDKQERKNRARIMYALITHLEGLRNCELVDTTSLSPGALSKHLLELKDDELVTEYSDERYRITPVKGVVTFNEYYFKGYMSYDFKEDELWWVPNCKEDRLRKVKKHKKAKNDEVIAPVVAPIHNVRYNVPGKKVLYVACSGRVDVIAHNPIGPNYDEFTDSVAPNMAKAAMRYADEANFDIDEGRISFYFKKHVPVKTHKGKGAKSSHSSSSGDEGGVSGQPDLERPKNESGYCQTGRFGVRNPPTHFETVPLKLLKGKETQSSHPPEDTERIEVNGDDDDPPDGSGWVEPSSSLTVWEDK